MALLIDASVFITLERRGGSPGEIQSLAPDELLGIASITAVELLTGVRRANTPERRDRRGAYVEALFLLIPIIHFELTAARLLAHIWADLAARGTPIGPYDSVVAVTALANGFEVFTDNIDEFSRVPGLVVRQPDWPEQAKV